jgi:hypothetical protein
VATATSHLALPPGSYSLTIETERVGEHAATSTTVPYTIERRPTTLGYTGMLGAQYSDAAAVSATLLDTLTGTPLDGRPIDFTLGTQAAAATTDAVGAAAGAIVIDQPAADLTLRASYAGDATYKPSEDTETFAIAKERLSFVYTGDTIVGAGATAHLAALATQEADGSPGDLARAAATFTLQPTLAATPFAVAAAVTASGAASTPATGLGGDLWRITVAVPAANGYFEGSSPAGAENLLATDSLSCGAVAGGLKTSNGAKAEIAVGCKGGATRELKAMFHFSTDADTFRAKSLVAFGVAADGSRAFAAGYGLDGRPYVVSVQDNSSGKTDRFHVWIGGVRRTSDGSLSSGNVTIDAG